MEDADKVVGQVHMQVADASQKFQGLAQRGMECLKRGATEEISEIFAQIVAASQRLHSISEAATSMQDAHKAEIAKRDAPAADDEATRRPGEDSPFSADSSRT